MTTTSVPTGVTGRDRAVLRAVAAGRCAMGPGRALTVDGIHCADQFAAHRLLGAGLIAAVAAVPSAARLTSTGAALLEAC